MREMMKRCLSLGCTLPIIVLTGILRTKSAPPAPPAGHTPLAAPPPRLDPSPVRILSGTVVRDGAHFALREADGTLFTLDSAGRAWTYEGEDVRITGRVDDISRIVQIQAIEAVDDLQLQPAWRRRGSRTA